MHLLNMEFVIILLNELCRWKLRMIHVVKQIEMSRRAFCFCHINNINYIYIIILHCCIYTALIKCSVVSYLIHVTHPLVSSTNPVWIPTRTERSFWQTDSSPVSYSTLNVSQRILQQAKTLLKFDQGSVSFFFLFTVCLDML